MKDLKQILLLIWCSFELMEASGKEIELLGPSSRRTPLVISEIMYQPSVRDDGKNLEFVEIYNSQPWFFDLSGCRLTGDIKYTFPEHTRLEANAFLVVAKVPDDLRAVYGLTEVAGGYEGELPIGEGKVVLEHRNGGVLLDVRYSVTDGWPVAANGAGHSAVVARPSLGHQSPDAWAASGFVGGSPGEMEPEVVDPLGSMVINELYARSDSEQNPFVELYNHSPNEVDLSGCWVWNDSGSNAFRIPDGAGISPGGFLVLNPSDMGFELNASGDTVYLGHPDRTRVLDAVRFGAHAKGVSYGRFPNGASVLRMLSEPTAGSSNDQFFQPDIVINELMYHPISGNKRDEYVELYNSGKERVDLSGWRFVSGIDFSFPSSTHLHPGAYLVIAKDAAWLQSKYPQLTSENTFGNYKGSLSNGGERVILARPELIQTRDDPGGIAEIQAYVIVDEVVYKDGGHWGTWADGGGSSLELIHPRADHLQASSWVDSDESEKSEWTLIEATGRMEPYDDTFSPIIKPADLQIMMLGQGECLVDAVEFTPLDGENLVVNGSFEEGLSGWVGQGTHQEVLVESSGFESASSAHLLTSGRGETMANRFLGSLATDFSPNGIVTLKAWGRWLQGGPEILMRLTCNFMEAYGRLAVPSDLGTPGATNSGSVPNDGPTIHSIEHMPILPEANQPVVVQAQVHDPDGLAEVLLRYRIDPSPEMHSLSMTDDGLGGDLVAGDGVFSATLPGQRARNLLAFHVMARDNSSEVSYEPEAAPERECLVRFGERAVEGQFGVYRLWMTQNTLNEWRQRLPLSNHPLPITFVYGNHRAIHNVGAAYAGNTFNPNMDSPTGRACDYTLVFPSDDCMLGETDMVLSWPGLMERPDPSAQWEQMAFWIGEQLGLPFNYRRYVVVYVQGTRRNQIMEDAQQPNREFVRQWFRRDSGGDLYKLAIQQDAARLSGQYGYYGLATLEDLPILDSGQKLSRYRWTWQKRSAQGRMNEYQSLIEMIQAMNLTDKAGYTQRVESLVDVDQWMRVMATERVVSNWDSFGYHGNKNMYFYKPESGPWQMLMWDIDQVDDGSRATADIFTHDDRSFPDIEIDPITQRWFAHAPFRRAYLRALQSAVEGPLLKVEELLDAKWEGLRESGIRLTSPSRVKTFLDSRRQSIIRQLSPFEVPFQVDGPLNADLSTSESTITLTGTAPFGLHTLQVNGQIWPPTWTTVTNWTLTLPLSEVRTDFEMIGKDVHGETVPGTTATVSVGYEGSLPLPPHDIRINEWMASNTRTLADPADNDYEDWFELYNPNPFPLALGGYSLSDDLADPDRFVIPADVTLPAQGYLLVWADGETRQNSMSRDLHTSFKLSRAGESLAIWDASGQLVDQVMFGQQTDDVSEGRWPDGSLDPSRSMALSTPRAPNLVHESVRPLQILRMQDSSDGIITLTWSAELGEVYAVERKDTLQEVNWEKASHVRAWGDTVSVILLKGDTQEGYYRIRTVPSDNQ